MSKKARDFPKRCYRDRNSFMGEQSGGRKTLVKKRSEALVPLKDYNGDSQELTVFLKDPLLQAVYARACVWVILVDSLLVFHNSMFRCLPTWFFLQPILFPFGLPNQYPYQSQSQSVTIFFFLFYCQDFFFLQHNYCLLHKTIFEISVVKPKTKRTIKLLIECYSVL